MFDTVVINNFAVLSLPTSPRSLAMTAVQQKPLNLNHNYFSAELSNYQIICQQICSAELSHAK